MWCIGRKNCNKRPPRFSVFVTQTTFFIYIPLVFFENKNDKGNRGCFFIEFKLGTNVINKQLQQQKKMYAHYSTRKFSCRRLPSRHIILIIFTILQNLMCVPLDDSVATRETHVIQNLLQYFIVISFLY